MTTHSLLAALLLTLPASAPADRLSWAPEPGLRLERRFESELSLAVEAVEVLFNDVDRTPESQLAALPRRTQRELLVVHDSVDGVSSFWPSRLSRSFVEAERTGETALGAGEPSPDAPRTSPLTGHEVVFLWVDEEAEHRKLYVGERGAAELLEGLEEDLDLRGLLPRGAVSQGDTWNIDPRALGPWLRPAGDLHLAADAESGRMEELRRRTLTGELEARYLGAREVDGRSLGIFSLAGELEAGGALDLGREALGTSDKSLEERWSLSLEGEVRWDLAAGHFAEARLAGEVSVLRLERYELQELGPNPEEPATDILIQHRTESSGQLSLQASCRPR